MSAIFEGRRSDSPFIEMVWRGHVEQDYSPVCPADVRWNLLFTKYQKQIRVSVEGATTQSVLKNQSEGSEFLVIKFKLGIFMPHVSVETLVNTDVILPEATSRTFWLRGSAWQVPDFGNVETFVSRLVREGILHTEPVVASTLNNEPIWMSPRTMRRRFLSATGLTPKTIQQIERVHQAVIMLKQGVSIPDTVYKLGYADQPHLTRSLRRFYGQTPAHVIRMSQTE